MYVSLRLPSTRLATAFCVLSTAPDSKPATARDGTDARMRSGNKNPARRAEKWSCRQPQIQPSQVTRQVELANLQQSIIWMMSEQRGVESSIAYRCYRLENQTRRDSSQLGYSNQSRKNCQPNLSGFYCKQTDLQQEYTHITYHLNKTKRCHIIPINKN